MAIFTSLFSIEFWCQFSALRGCRQEPQFWESQGFLTALLGAVAGSVVSGIVTWFLQRSEFTRQQKLRDEQELKHKQLLAHTLLFKLGRIHDGLIEFVSHFENCRARAGQEWQQPGLWRFVTPFASFPHKVMISDDELSNIFLFKAPELFNRVSDSFLQFNRLVDLMVFVSDKRREIAAHHPPAYFENGEVVYEIDAELSVKLSPDIHGFDQVVGWIDQDSAKLMVGVHSAMQELTLLFRQKMAMPTLKLVERDPVG